MFFFIAHQTYHGTLPISISVPGFAFSKAYPDKTRVHF